MRRTLLVGLIAASTAAPAAAGPLARPDDPVVLTHNNIAPLDGAGPGDVVAFRYAGGWEQIPVQVDERVLIDVRKAYKEMFSCSDPCYGPPANPVGPYLEYADPDTWIGADPDKKVDADDEVVFMAKDAGGVRGGGELPAGTVGEPLEVKITDPIDSGEGYVYLFRQDGSLEPSAGRKYVDYDFKLLSGDYKTTYKYKAGPNPEASTVVTPSYSRKFTDRWLESELRNTRGAATGKDLLDRVEAGFDPDATCVRSVDTFTRGEGAYLTNKSGPVRAIRDFVGANSGPTVQRRFFFYENKEVITTFLRVHPIPGVMEWVDYSDEAIGMTYANAFTPLPITIDGQMDPVTGTGLMSDPTMMWEQVDGPQGGLTYTYDVQATILDPTYKLFYEDNASNALRNRCDGDAKAIGASGPMISPLVESTDEGSGSGPAKLTETRTRYYEAPGRANGPQRRSQSSNPLQATVTQP
jgi:hypothetical protein